MNKLKYLLVKGFPKVFARQVTQRQCYVSYPLIPFHVLGCTPTVDPYTKVTGGEPCSRVTG